LGSTFLARKAGARTAVNETSANTESTPAITAQDRNPIELRLLTDPQYFNQLVRVEVELTDSICCKCA
jgi:hypothetical protein